MLGKSFDFLVLVAVNGILAFLISAAFYVILAIVFLFAVIPVATIAGNEVAQKVVIIAGNDLGYKVIYTIVFISMILDDLGVPNFKTVFKRWQQKKSA